MRIPAFPRLILPALAVGLLPLSPAAAQEAVTTPVGVVSIRLDANKKAALSLPLEKSPVAVGTVTSVSSSTITDSSASFDSLGSTHFVRFRSGNASGRCLRVTSNTSNSLTVQTGTGSWSLPLDSSGGNSINVAPGDSYEVVPMWTLGEIFGNNSADSVLRTASNPNQADQVSVYVDGTQSAYFNNGTNWRNAVTPGDTTNYNSLGILPTSGLWITRRSAGTNAVLEFTGQVPAVAPRYHLPGGAKFAQSIPLPAGATLGNLGFSAMSSWNRSNNPNNADQVTVYRPDNSISAFFVNAAGIWRNAVTPGDTTDYTNVEIPTGSGLWINRRGSASGVSANAQSSLPYNLN